MPKSTFYNLNEEKKEKIKKALKKEFTKNTFEKVSISHIIEEAKIPRGSFYQYFEDKEDAFKYIIKDFMDEEEKETKKILLNNNGDIFLTTLDLYEHFTNKCYHKKEIQLFKNIIIKLRNENINIYKNIQLKSENMNNDYINTDILNIEDNEDIKYIFKILICILTTEMIDVIAGKISKEKRKRRTI